MFQPAIFEKCIWRLFRLDCNQEGNTGWIVFYLCKIFTQAISITIVKSFPSWNVIQIFPSINVDWVTTSDESLRSDLITKFLQIRPKEIFRVTIFTAFSTKSRNSIGKSLRVSSKTFFPTISTRYFYRWRRMHEWCIMKFSEMIQFSLAASWIEQQNFKFCLSDLQHVAINWKKSAPFMSHLASFRLNWFLSFIKR